MARPAPTRDATAYLSTSTTYDNSTRLLSIGWADGHVSQFPFIWLRHHLYYPSLGRPGQADDSDNVYPEDPAAMSIASATALDGSIEIQWAHDGSTTEHSTSFLRDNCLSETARAARQPKPVHWTGRDAAEFPWFDASDLENPAGRFEVFQHVRDYGLALVRNVPIEPGTIMHISKLFGPVRRTHHGSLFNIRSLPEDRQGVRANIGATASNTLAPHTDEGFRHAPLGIMLFHCLKAPGFRSIWTPPIHHCCLVVVPEFVALAWCGFADR